MTDEKIKKMAKGIKEQAEKNVKNGFNMENFGLIMLIAFLEKKGLLTPKEFFEFYIDNYEFFQNEICQVEQSINEETIIKALKKEI